MASSSNLFSLAPSAHVFLEPLALVSGALWRLGLSIQLAYLIWKPLAALALFAAAFVWARRFFERQAARMAAIALALFLYAPASWIMNWGKLGTGGFRFQVYLIGWEVLAANKLWGYAPSAFAIALMPVVMLSLERALEAPRGRSWIGPSALAAGAALLAALLHPWQGVTVLVVLGGLAVWQRLRGLRTLILPALGAALALGYYYLLAHTDPTWKLASAHEAANRVPTTALLLALGPLAVIAALGLHRPGAAVAERALLLWVLGSFVTYYAVDSFPTHAFQGLSFPLAVLAVRAGQRLRLPVPAGALAVAAVSIPGLAWDAQKLLLSAHGTVPQYYLTAGDASALDWVASAAPAGGVLAPEPFADVVPSQTGRAVWVGHPYWSEDYHVRAHLDNTLFDGRMRPRAARAFVASTGASLLVADCGHRADLTRALGPMLASVHRFGCATVYVLRTQAAG